VPVLADDDAQLTADNIALDKLILGEALRGN
jgi:hypothetical protein